jgi:hypothetical protein
MYGHDINVYYGTHFVKRLFKEFSEFLMGYFFGFGTVSGSSGLALGGRPFPGTLRMVSSDEKRDKRRSRRG